ncbi:hypothetical protein ACFSJY_08260 [Thalassotalea euphylliae]|uniref:hypothetical protein n=1 Tax=Thalassotalea euphylliae TaxID=1655234 RepID=UPI00362558EC
MNSDVNKLLNSHNQLTHTNDIKVESHVQREQEDWYVNTIMLEGISTPFKYKRKRLYRSLKGNRVNITYYPTTENVAGIDIEVMNIVRIKIA